MTTPQPANNAVPVTQAPAKGLAIAAVVAGGVAFLIGLVPFVGALAGLAAIALGIFALVKKQNRLMAWIGLGLGTIATVTCIIFTTIIFAVGSALPSPMPVPGTNVEQPMEPAEEPELAPSEAPEPSGPTDDERAARFERDLKDGLGVNDSFQELLYDPTLWGGYIADVRYQTGNIYVTLQVDGSTPDGRDLGQRAAKAISTLMTQETVDAVDYSWVIVEDGGGTVIDQKQPKPIM